MYSPPGAKQNDPVQSRTVLVLTVLLAACGGDDDAPPPDPDPVRWTCPEQWVEHGEAPSSMVATKTSGPGTNRSRPLCAFPQHAVYTGAGSIDDAANFVCRGAPLGR